MLGPLLLAAVLAAPRSAPVETDVFHGWSRDGRWLVYEAHGANDLVELYFCPTSPDDAPPWPRVLDESDREPVAPGLSCVHFLDPNKAPWQWKAQLALPAPSARGAGLAVSNELSTDGENPGFVLVAGDQKQACYASGVREDSRLQKTWFHPSGRFVAALIDGRFHHCAVTLRGVAAPPPRPPPGKPPVKAPLKRK
jgi:hypothetical protein